MEFVLVCPIVRYNREEHTQLERYRYATTVGFSTVSCGIQQVSTLLCYDSVLSVRNPLSFLDGNARKGAGRMGEVGPPASGRGIFTPLFAPFALNRHQAL